MTKDEIFIAQHKKAMGEEKAKKMLEDLKKSLKTDDKPKKMYISVYGGEVHVNGPVVVQVDKPETLVQKIARFERLAESVHATRSLMLNLAQDIMSEEDDDDKILDDVEDLDAFGEPVHDQSVTEPDMCSEAATDDASGQQIIADDESAQIAASSAVAPAQPSGMPSQE